MGNPICRTPDCTKAGKNRGGLCYRCFRDAVEAGFVPDPRAECIVPDCTDRRGWGAPVTPGYCIKHHKQVQRRGMIDPPPFVRPPRLCDVDDCAGKHYSLGYCIAHYQRWSRYGTTELGSVKNPTYVCEVCDVEFERPHHMASRTIRCPEHREVGRAISRARWAAANPEQARQSAIDHTHRWRAAQMQVPFEDVDRLVVFNRDGWICQLCDWAIDPATKGPHPRTASLDHIIPLSKGGHHTYANTQLACLTCNQHKSAKLPDVG